MELVSYYPFRGMHLSATAASNPIVVDTIGLVHTGRSPFTVTRVPERVCGQ
jgi:hypothetical protein